MALTDMYSIKHHQTGFSLNFLNVYHVQRANAGERALTISDGFQNSVLPSIRAYQSDAILNATLDIQNLGDPTDFAVVAIPAAPGLRVGADMPSFNSGELRFPRLRTDMRNGYKRFIGLIEPDVNDQTIVAATLTLLNTIGTAMVGNWLSSIDSHIICNYVIIKRVCASVPLPGNPCPQYRLPESDAELVFYQPGQGQALTTVRSQVSRKVGA